MLKSVQNTFLTSLACLVSIGGILYGYDMGVISGALLFIQSAIPMSNTEIGVIVGAVLAGCLFGTLLSGPLADRYGRRILIVTASVIFIIGVSLVLFAKSFMTILLARLFLGVGVGMVSVGVPLYVAEMVPAHSRGKYMTFFQLLLTFGIVLAYFVDLIFTPSGNWRGMFAVLLLPSSILLLGILYLPESPRWLLLHHRRAEAKQVLEKIRNHPDEVEADLRLIETSLHRKQASFREIFSGEWLGPCSLAVAVSIFNQLTGINAFLQYAPLILKTTGISSNWVSMLGSLGIGMINFIVTLIAILLIDTVGRRPLLLLGILGVIFSEIYLFFITRFFVGAPLLGYLSLLGLGSFIAFFALGPGVVVWLAISELFPTRVRGKGMSISLFFSSLSATLLSVYFLRLVNNLGISGTFLIFAGLSSLYFLIVWKYLPETMARSLEEIQSSYGSHKEPEKVSHLILNDDKI